MVPKVKSRNGELRESRGFSIGEIQGAGATLSKATELKLGIDKRRRSVHSFNVDILKQAILKKKKAEKAISQPDKKEEKQIKKAPEKKATVPKKTEKKE